MIYGQLPLLSPESSRSVAFTRKASNLVPESGHRELGNWMNGRSNIETTEARQTCYNHPVRNRGYPGTICIARTAVGTLNKWETSNQVRLNDINPHTIDNRRPVRIPKTCIIITAIARLVIKPMSKVG